MSRCESGKYKLCASNSLLVVIRCDRCADVFLFSSSTSWTLSSAVFVADSVVSSRLQSVKSVCCLCVCIVVAACASVLSLSHTHTLIFLVSVSFFLLACSRSLSHPRNVTTVVTPSRARSTTRTVQRVSQSLAAWTNCAASVLRLVDDRLFSLLLFSTTLDLVRTSVISSVSRRVLFSCNGGVRCSVSSRPHHAFFRCNVCAPTSFHSAHLTSTVAQHKSRCSDESAHWHH